MEVQHQGDKEETLIHTSRRGRDGQPGLSELTARWPDPERWRIVERTGQAVWQLADQGIPHWHKRQTAQPRAPVWANKASNH